MRFHFDDRQAAAFVGHGFAGCGMWPRRMSRKPARVSTPPSRGRLHCICVSRSRRFTPPSISSAPLAVVSTGTAGESNSSSNSPVKLLDGVFGRDQADGGAVFVHDDGHVAAALLEVADQIEDGLGFRNDKNVAHDLLSQAELEERRRSQVVARVFWDEST
jgi:hypothetical protein